jgi:cation transport ATPase
MPLISSTSELDNMLCITTFICRPWNLFAAFAYNTAAVPIAAGLLYPATGLLLNPVIAAAAMAMSSVSVLLNSLRLGREGLA